MTFANQKLNFDLSKIERLFYQSASFFKKINWSNFQNSRKPPEPVYLHFTRKFYSLRMRRNNFILIIFIYLSAVLHETGNMKQFLGGWNVYVTLPSQVCSSYLRDYMANLIRNIKAFPNAIKNLVVCLLWNISLIHLKYKS